MKIYFAGSISGGRSDAELYLELINHLKNHGTVLTEHIGKSTLKSTGENLSPESVFQRYVNWIKESDVIIAEVTTTSLGVGYELGIAESLSKPVLLLYRRSEGKQLSFMLSGNKRFKLAEYQMLDVAYKKIDEFLSGLNPNAGHGKSRGT